MGGLFDRLQAELDDREQPGGLSPLDLLDMPAPLAAVIQKIIRQNGMTLTDIAAAISQTPAETRAVLDKLIDRGWVRQVEVGAELWYKARFGRKIDTTRGQGVWSALDSLIDPE